MILHPAARKDTDRKDPRYALSEAMALAAALPSVEIVDAQIVALEKPRAGLLFGRGKVAEIGQDLERQKIKLVLIDGPVTPIQQRNLEKAWDVKILDRTGLIIEIFSARAQTREGVLQVELAALSYQRTRMVRAWTHLERQRGGLGFVGGPGETQIEADRRAIDAQKKRLSNQLERVRKTRLLHRKSRQKTPFPIVALVGYTNAGKSTLFNRLTGADVFAKDVLFATLDPTMRAVKISAGMEVILSDTVGFISDLPTHLIAAFRSTLEEVLDADLILHIRDIAHPLSEAQANNVEAILTDLGCKQTQPIIEVWNKADLLDPETSDALRKKAKNTGNAAIVSALTGGGLDQVIDNIRAVLRPKTTKKHIMLPNSAGRARAWLYERALVVNEAVSEQGWALDVVWSTRQCAEFTSILKLLGSERCEGGNARGSSARKIKIS